MDVRKLCRTCLRDNEISLKSIYLKAAVVFDIPKCSILEMHDESAAHRVDYVLLVDMLNECCKPIVSEEQTLDLNLKFKVWLYSFRYRSAMGKCQSSFVRNARMN